MTQPNSPLPGEGREDTEPKKMKTRIQTILRQISEGVYEKDAELAFSLLAAIAGQSILLLGPPGLAKSMVARRLKYAFAGACSFEYLMSRFSTPDEIFGPVSIRQLKDSDRYERRTQGYLPEADVVFLDEIWKAGPAIQNTLLQVINEKTFLNGDRLMQLPLKLLIGASNELPTQGEGLEALWDRFILRLICQPIGAEENFYRMIAGDSHAFEEKQGEAAITPLEYAAWQQEIDQVEIPQEVLLAITAIRKSLKDVSIEGQDVHRSLYVSDRRWQRIARLLRTSAFLHDRKTVSLSDLQICVHALWNEPDEIPAVGRIVAAAIFQVYQQRLDAIQQHVSRALRIRSAKEAVEKAMDRGDHRDDDLVIYDSYYYGIVDNPSAPRVTLFMPVPEFKHLPTHTSDEPALRGVMYQDPKVPQRRIIRAVTNPDNIGVVTDGLTRVNLYRDSSNIYVNGVRFGLRRAARGENVWQASGLEPVLPADNTPIDAYETEVDQLFQEATIFNSQLKNHLFLSAEVAQLVNAQMDGFRRQIALTRADLRKIIYDE